MPDPREAIRRDGYVILPGLLDAAEITRLRAGLRAHFAAQWTWEGLGKHQPGAAIAVPAIGWVFAHPRILAAFRTLTASDAPVFTGNCDAHMNMLSWWHKDTSEKEGGCFKGDYFGNPSLRVLRAGIYLQDHDADGHGLHVRRGSHHTRGLAEGAEETLRTRAGDVVFFDIRLTHAGQFADPLERVLLRASWRAPALAWGVKEGWRRLRGSQEKLSIFFTVGAPGQDTADYCAFEAAARRVRDPGARLAPGLVEALARQGVACNPELVG